ncbi:MULTISPECIES: ABC transporter family substrate-binding protein [Streptosporangium]|uniref:Peptide/nickel transport system substrate-binding protein n=1 Tax=Streptosporangium brasiliense TaxID=47480 RepID=A0ABT9QVN9_9ACTN|nr:ABC transporter family substrate-binding protein [Streptosporangium brasiliense]MDP9861038.1 peptide/nickel transport system substrate-binding protein [Streptosporangium brasiliense]
MKVGYKAVAGTALLAMALTACGGGGADKPKAGSSEAAKEAQQQAAGLAGSATNPVPYDQVAEGGVVKLALSGWQTQWNYNQVNGTHATTDDVIEPLMPLVAIANDKAEVTNNPDYVTEWKMELTGGKQVVTYKIHEKATWSDGKPITYKDFQAQWKALSGENKKYQVSSTDGYDRVESVEKGATDKDVVVTFAKNYPDWPGMFSPLYPASTNETPEAFNKGWIDKIPVTAGPFKVESIDQTSKAATLVRDDKWWGQKAKLDKVIFRGMDATAVLNAFANGELDAVEVPVNAADLKRAKEVPNADIRKAAAPNWRHITVNGSSDFLKDKSVRQAIQLGINRETIAASDLKDMDWPVQTLNNHLYMNTHKGYVDNSGELGKYNPEKAKQMLEAAGWKQEGEYRKKDGKEFSLRFIVPASLPTAKQEGELTQAMLKEVGVKVVIEPVPDDKLFDDFIIPGNFDLAPFSWLGTPFPNGALPQIYRTPESAENFGSNFPRIGTPELDKLIDQAAGEMDPAKAIELGNAADKMIWDEVHTIPLYQRPDIYATKKTLANYGSFGYSDKNWTTVGYTK